MCRYNISIDDNLMGKVRSTFINVKDEEQWLQEQVTLMLMQMISHKGSNKPKMTLAQGLRGIIMLPKDFDYKKELEERD